MSSPISKIKRFFWSIAGSEISVLEKCLADHNRHVNIGLAIFVTTLIAFFTGSLAGFRFGSQNFASALTFGAIWSLLVFTIDRNMVSTLQKKPPGDQEKVRVLEFLKLFFGVLYRAILSMLIAFFIAIPLELWIFQEEIAKQMKFDNDAEILNQRNTEERIYNISGLEKESKKYSQERTRLDSLLNRREPPSGYKNYRLIKQDMENAKSNYDSKLRDYNKKVSLRKEYYSKAPAYFDSTRNEYVKDKNSDYYKKWYALWIRTNPYNGPETKILNQLKKEYDELAQTVSTIQQEYFVETSRQKQTYDSLYTDKMRELVTRSDSVQIATAEHERFVYSQKGFIKQWIALNNISNYWVSFFIWFIRFVFFVIEMLPTLTKILTPVGSYDIKLYYQNQEVQSNSEYEMDLLKEFQSKKMKLLINNMTKIEQQKIKHELKLQEEILNNLATRQNNIANIILSEWENQQKENIHNDLLKFMNDNDKKNKN